MLFVSVWKMKNTGAQEIGDGSHSKENYVADEKPFKEEASGLISEKIYSTTTNYSSI